jgi:hypothetical protein
VEARRVSRGWGSHMAARLSALHAGHLLSPKKFLVLISVRGWVDPRAIVWLEGLGKLKKSTSSRTRTGDLPACSIVPQPTMQPCAPLLILKLIIKDWLFEFQQTVQCCMYNPSETPWWSQEKC